MNLLKLRWVDELDRGTSVCGRYGIVRSASGRSWIPYIVDHRGEAQTLDEFNHPTTRDEAKARCEEWNRAGHIFAARSLYAPTFRPQP